MNAGPDCVQAGITALFCVLFAFLSKAARLRGFIALLPGSQGNGAAIGGGNHSGAGGSITITGGTIYAAGMHGAGLGGGRGDDTHYGHNSGAGGIITITGGTVHANSSYGFGIGAGSQQGNMDYAEYPDDNKDLIGTAGTVTIGGDAYVEAWGRVAGIGGDSGRITITGGEVVVSGSTDSKNGSGIALFASNKSEGNIHISGGTITANAVGQAWGARIGGGADADGGTIVIEGGHVTAIGGYGAGIGGGLNLSGGSVTGNAAGGGQNGGGIYYTGGTLNLSGAPLAWGNVASTVKDNNLYLNNSRVITAVDAFEAGLRIGVTSYANPGAGSPVVIVTGASASAGIVSDRAEYLIMTDENQQVRMIVRPVFATPDFTLPACTLAVEQSAFEGIGARAVEIPVSCAAIGDCAFRDCASLTQIRIPANCALGEDVFDGCGRVFIFGTAGSPAEAYCNDPDHSNCVFVVETQN